MLNKMMFQEDIPLKEFNTFGIDVMARYFACFNNIGSLQEMLEAYRHFKTGDNHPLLVLGGGSNILFTKDVDGLVLKNEISGIEKTGEDDGHYFIKAGAGVNWHRFVLYCLEHDYAGVENLALIPGSVGASPMQNIGAYGVEIKDVFHSLEAMEISTGKMVTFSKSDCAFGYRESVFKNKCKGEYIITSVTYRLNKIPVYNTSYGAIEAELEKEKPASISIQAIARAVINIRSSKLPDPAVIGNAGSFFKNPEISQSRFEELKERFPGIVGYPVDNGQVKLAAGWLIEQCGPVAGKSWKGYRIGDAGCHEKQALVLVNHGHATGSHLFNLSASIMESVFEKFSVTLEREVNVY